MKTYKPYTKSRRHLSVVNYRAALTGSEPHKALTSGFRRGSGRDGAGRISVRHKGGGHKRRWREIDFSYTKQIPGRVETVEYDPNRSGFIGLVLYADGSRRYALLPKSARAGMPIETGPAASLVPGNRLPLKNIPIGTFVYNVELKPMGGAKLGRSAGVHLEVMAATAKYVDLKMPSSEVRKVLNDCWATIGEVGNEEHKLTNYGKAGRSRWKGIRPTVRGTAMNPVDHPHGGGEGRQGRGRRRAVSMWGRPTGKGQKTRHLKKYSRNLIVSRRKVGKRRKAS